MRLSGVREELQGVIQTLRGENIRCDEWMRCVCVFVWMSFSCCFLTFSVLFFSIICRFVFLNSFSFSERHQRMVIVWFTWPKVAIDGFNRIRMETSIFWLFYLWHIICFDYLSGLFCDFFFSAILMSIFFVLTCLYNFVLFCIYIWIIFFISFKSSLVVYIRHIFIFVLT